MNIISQILENDNQKEFLINRFFKENSISKILKKSNFNKEQGIPTVQVFKLIFTLIFTNKNLYRLLESSKEQINFSKDVVYRFLNSIHYNWKKFLILLASNVITNKISNLTAEDRVNVLIVDDSTYSRNRSKNVELLARVKDHASNRYVKGFKLLTLGWSDGNSFIPVSFNLMSSGNTRNRLCAAKDIDKRTNGYKARYSSVQKQTDSMILMLKEAVQAKIPAKYALFDSWFTYPSTISKIIDLNLDVIAMVKKMPKVYYEYQGKLMNIERIYASLTKKRGRAQILASTIVKINSSGDKNISLKIVFVRNKNKKREWLALITSDLTLSDEEVVRIYGKRWDIEVFFKMTKSYLKLGKEFQGRSYDSMVAHTTIVFTRYIMLAIENRQVKDPRSFGGLFFACCDELEDVKFTEILNGLLKILMNAIRNNFLATKEQIDNLINYFFDNLPNVFKDLNVNFGCES